MDTVRSGWRNEPDHPPPHGITFGYARVSTADQRLDLQLQAFEKAGVHPDYIYQEHISGVKAKRPQLTECLRLMRTGDTLVVWKLDRLGRSTRELLSIIDDLKERGIYFKSLNDYIDTDTAVGELFFTIMAAFAQFERDLISERTIAGLRASKKKGRMGGRKPKLSDQQIKEGIDLLRFGKWNVSRLCRVYQIGRNTWYRAEKRYLDKQAKKIEQAREAA